MPLDNKNLTPAMQDIMRNLSYEDKISIYDTKCKGCGYMLIKVGDMAVRSLEETFDIAQSTNEEIERSCDYPEDVMECYGEEVYPSLNEIVSNGCRFWNPKNIEEGKCVGEKLSK
jgi:hypothetical protein